MPRFEELIELNKELLKMVDFTFPTWNSGARYWLEHRGPSLARAISDSAGLKLWLQSPPQTDLSYILKVCSLFADHTIIGHCGPLPPLSFGLGFPWRMDDSTEIPPPPFESETPLLYPLRLDAVKRPLPPVSKQCLLGPIRKAIELGMVTYFPASIIYSPILNEPWPSPGEILSREGNLPKGYRFLVRTKSETEKQDIPETDSDVNNQAETERNNDEGYTIGKMGYFEFKDPRKSRFVWEWSDNAMNWELLFSSLITSGNMEIPNESVIRLSRMPDALIEIKLPYLESADWETIYKVREKEKDSLGSLRESILKACSKVNAEHGSKKFENAVKEIQKNIIDKGINDVKKSFRSKNFHQYLKLTGLGIVTVSLEIACYLGLPPLFYFNRGWGRFK